MTAQLNDIVKHEGLEYDLVGIAGAQLPRPDEFGLVPQSTCTACWRGFQMAYAIDDDVLRLVEMIVDGQDEVRKVRGARGKRLDGGSVRYRFRNRPVEFTGKLLLAREFVRERYVHMGFQSPTAYESVLELRLERGRLVSSAALTPEAVRARVARKEAINDPKGWIEASFSRDFDHERS